MNSLLIKIGSAVLALGTIIGTALPSLADDDWRDRDWRDRDHCDRNAYFNNFDNFSYRHPGRASVLNRDALMNYEISRDYGLLHGNYGRLRGEEQAIMRQAQIDAYRNGGYLTPVQFQYLTNEENNLQAQINYDHRCR